MPTHKLRDDTQKCIAKNIAKKDYYLHCTLFGAILVFIQNFISQSN